MPPHLRPWRQWRAVRGTSRPGARPVILRHAAPIATLLAPMPRRLAAPIGRIHAMLERPQPATAEAVRTANAQATMTLGNVRPIAALFCESWLRHGTPAYPTRAASG